MDVSFADPETIGPTIAPRHTHKEPFGRLTKEASGVKIGTQIGTKSNRLERTERIQIGMSTKAHCMMTVLGLRTIGTEIGGMTIAMIGLRIGHGMTIRFGSPPVGSLRFSRRHCHHHFIRLLLRHLPRLRPRPLRRKRNCRLLPQSLRVHRDWQTPATLLMRVSLPLAARVTREAQALREHRAQVLRVSCSLEH